MKVLPASLTVFLLSVPALAADLAPAWRGEPTSTYQQWVFATDGGGAGMYASPDGPFANPYGLPWALFGGGSWTAGGGMSGDGAWLFSVSQYWIPNDPASPSDGKLVRIQMQWKDQPPMVGIEDVMASTWSCDSFFDVPLADGWTLTVQDWSAPTHSEAEMVQIWATGLLDSVTIDTLIVPAPAVLPMLALGMLAMLRKTNSGANSRNR